MKHPHVVHSLNQLQEKTLPSFYFESLLLQDDAARSRHDSAAHGSSSNGPAAAATAAAVEPNDSTSVSPSSAADTPADVESATVSGSCSDKHNLVLYGPFYFSSISIYHVHLDFSNYRNVSIENGDLGLLFR